jgi:hypothetical protein
MSQELTRKLTENFDVVRFYLHEAFPERQVEVILEPEPERQQNRGSRIFDHGDACFLNVPYEFLSAYDVRAVNDYLPMERGPTPA